MTRIAVTILLMIAWHFPTTFFVPQDAPNERGWLIWPFGRASTPVLDGLQGAIAPASPAALGSRTLAMVAAGLASIAFVVAIAALWGIVTRPHGCSRRPSSAPSAPWRCSSST